MRRKHHKFVGSVNVIISKLVRETAARLHELVEEEKCILSKLLYYSSGFLNERKQKGNLLCPLSLAHENGAGPAPPGSLKPFATITKPTRSGSTSQMNIVAFDG